MKKFLIPIVLLLTFSTSTNADPFKQMLKGGAKGGLKGGNKEEKSWTKVVWEKKLTDKSPATKITIKYDSFTKEKSCFSYPRLPNFIELDGLKALEGEGNGDFERKSIFIFTFKDQPLQFKWDQIPTIYEDPPNTVNEASYEIWSKFKKLKTRSTYPSFRGVLDGKMNPSYTKDEVIFLNRIDDYLKARKRYGCNKKK